jgi:hypothetical protein
VGQLPCQGPMLVPSLHSVIYIVYSQGKNKATRLLHAHTREELAISLNHGTNLQPFIWTQQCKSVLIPEPAPISVRSPLAHT